MTDGGGLSNPAWSYSGRYIAVWGLGHVWIVSSAGRLRDAGASRLLRDVGGEVASIWSPTADILAVARRRNHVRGRGVRRCDGHGRRCTGRNDMESRWHAARGGRFERLQQQAGALHHARPRPLRSWPGPSPAIPLAVRLGSGGATARRNRRNADDRRGLVSRWPLRPLLGQPNPVVGHPRRGCRPLCRAHRRRPTHAYRRLPPLRRLHRTAPGQFG